MQAKAEPLRFAELVLYQARLNPEKPAIIMPDRVVTYAMFARAVASVETRVRALGLEAGSLVALTIDSATRYFALAAALSRCGLTFVPLSNAAEARDLRLPVDVFLHDPGAKLVPGTRQVTVTDEWFAPLPEGAAEGRPAISDPDQIFCVSLSSGTTGKPKPVSATLGDFTDQIGYYLYVIENGNWDRMLCSLSEKGYFGLLLMGHALAAGKTLVCGDTPRECLEMMSLYHVEIFCASVRQLQDVVSEQQRGPFVDCAGLKRIITGGSVLSPALLGLIQSNLCRNLTTIYGTTETGGNVLGTSEVLKHGGGAAGYVTPWTQLDILDDSGTPVPAGVEGTVRISCKEICKPYPPGRTDGGDAHRDDGFYPGDRGFIRKDGMFFITGRTSEVLNSGGYKTTPEAAEAIIVAHPAIADAAAVSILSSTGMEEIAAAVIATGPFNEDHLRKFCLERGLPLTRILLVDVLPLTAGGKLDRAAVREKFA